jgi:CelD/BcsL family acetyltransferase involved in cellulose biosynthesis
MTAADRPAADYVVRVCGDFDTLPGTDWADLSARSLEVSVFQDPAWVRAWWETSRPAGAELHLAAAYRHDRLVALAPLYRAPSSNGSYDLHFLGGFHNDYQLFLVDRDHADSVSVLVRHAAVGAEGVRRVHFSEVVEGSLLHGALVEPRVRAVEQDPTPCPVLDLEDQAMVERLWAKKSVLRKLRRMERQGHVSVDHTSERSAILAQLDDLFVLHRARWSGTHSPSAFHDARTEAFYRRFVETAAEGKVVFTAARLDGAVVACHLGLVSGSDFLWYKAAYDPAVADLSPGLVMLSEIVRMAHREGFERLDFTRGDEPFKARFASRMRRNVNFVVHRSLADYAAARVRRSLQLAYRRWRSAWRRGRIHAKTLKLSREPTNRRIRPR